MAKDLWERSCLHGVTEPIALMRGSCAQEPYFKRSADKTEDVWEGDAKKMKALEETPCRAIPEECSA